MINKKDIVDTITLLKMTYPGSLKDLQEDELKMMVDIWYEDFKNTPKEKFNKAIQEIRYTNKFFPSIADIKEKVAKGNVSLPLAEDEWQEVINSIRKYGYYRQEQALESLNPYTRKITQYIGFERICMASPEEQKWNKKNFIEEYNSLKDKEINNLQISSNGKLMLNE